MLVHPLKATAKTLPLSPGIYQFLDTAENILYVGKAKLLRKRVLQYFDIKRIDPTKVEMVRRATALKTIVTTNEMEALALEATLIQTHRPPYNVRLVDDSSYLYVKVTDETYPQISLTRTVLPDGAWYRGPYPNARAIRHTLKEARRLFPWCAYPHPAASKGRACFAFHIGLCPGICVGAITLEEYAQNIKNLKRFLDGDAKETLRALAERMKQLSHVQQFERAARVRDVLRDIETSLTPQHVATPRHESVDAIGVARHGTHANATVLQVRNGRVLGTQTFGLLYPPDETTPDVLRGFLLQYYAQAQEHAPLIVLPEAVPDDTFLASWICEKTQTDVALHVAERGWKRKLMDLARANAEEALARSLTELTSPANLTKALEDIQKALSLPAPPKRMECYDISNIQGTLPTASMVVFVDGKPATREYRKFHITLPETPNDFAMMEEVLSRRFSRTGKQTTKKEWPLPDLVLIDGGKGQLGVARTVLKRLNIACPIASIAKREEELFLPGQSRPILLPRTSPALYLLQRIRDEAHRFTLGYHRLLRKKRMTTSFLEQIPGVGNTTRKKLLRVFGSLAGIRNASQADIEAVLQNKTTAARVYQTLSSHPS